jgi:hypothetical protein
MFRAVGLLLLAAAVSRADDVSSQILRQIRLKVSEQLKGAANYSCVQTIDRTYFRPVHYQAFGCEHQRVDNKRKEIMHDRLRLDIAVSEGREIYSWHGGSSFSSAGIADLVHSGPINSGSFVGYLENIFLGSGIQFEYVGETRKNGVEAYQFNYSVPLEVSHHEVSGKDSNGVRVPFHGNFFANLQTFELVSLQVIVDEVPPEVEICRADVEMNYGLAKISGHDSLIPQMFALNIEDASHLTTSSRSEYNECREFRGESTLHFEMTESAEQKTDASLVSSRAFLPAGVPLHVRLITPITEASTFTGDPVQGELLDPIHIKGKTNQVIPKGAVLAGIVTRLERRDEPSKHFLYSIEFHRLQFGNESISLNAHPKPSKDSAKQLTTVYGRFPSWLDLEYRNGIFVSLSSKLQTDQHFSSFWETVKPSVEVH